MVIKRNTIHCMHVLDGVRQLSDESIDMIITSPPYWSLRDYGKSTESVWDADPKCKHRFGKPIIKKRTGGGRTSLIGIHRRGIGHYKNRSYFCLKCGAWKGQLGLEPSFQLYVKHLLDIFSEIKRVLKKSGICWINLGDTYGGNNMTAGSVAKNKVRFNKSLLGIPEQFMLGMLEQGWTLRNKIIWHKKNHMPTSAKDRFACSWDYLFFFVKSKKYYFDLDSIRQPLTKASYERMKSLRQQINKKGAPNNTQQGRAPDDAMTVDYWSLSTGARKEPHYATYPARLIKTPILAGCPERVCIKCGLPQLTRKDGGKIAFNLRIHDSKAGKAISLDRRASKQEQESYAEFYRPKINPKRIFNCSCNAGFKSGIVLDPFMGSGTTAVVARQLSRDFIGFEINPEYVEMAKSRLEAA